MATGISKMVIHFIADTAGVKAAMADLNSNINSFGSKIQQNLSYTNNSIANVGTSMVNFGNGLSTVGGAMTKFISLPLIGIGAAAIKTGIEFETAFTGVKKTIDENEATADRAATTFSVLRNNILDLGMKTGVSIDKIAGAMQMAGQLGIRGNEALTKFTEEVVKLEITTGVAADSMTMMLGKFTAIMGTDVAAKIEGISSAITKLGNNNATTEAEIARFAVRMAAAGKLVNMTEADILAISAAFESTGTKAERGGTAVTKILLAMSSEATGTAKSIDEFSKKVKANTTEISNLETELTKLKDRQANLGTNASAEEMQSLGRQVDTVIDRISALREENTALAESAKSAGSNTTSFAKLLGMTTEEFKALYGTAGGSTKIFTGFVNVIKDTMAAGKDVNEIFKGLGLTDTRLVQSVLSLAQSNTSVTDSMGNESFAARSLSADLLLANEAMNGVSATDTEFNKFIDTVSGQFSRLKQAWKAFAVIMTDDTNGAIKGVLKSITDGFVKFVDSLQKLQETSPGTLQAIVKSLVGLVTLGPAMAIFGKMFSGVGKTFQTVGGTLGMFSAGLKGLADTDYMDALASGDVDLLWKAQKAKESSAYQFGKKFQDSWIKGAFDTASTSYKTGIDNFTKNIQTKLNAMPKGPRIAGTTAPLPRGENGKFRSPTGMEKFLAQTSDKFKGVANMVMPFVNTLLTAVPQIAVALGGLSIVLAAVAAGFTLFFVMTGQSTENVKAMFTGISENIAGFGERIKEVLGNLIAGFPEFAKKFGEMFPVVVAGITGIIVSLVEAFFAILPQALQLGGMFLTSLITGFVDSLPMLLSSVIQILMAIATGFIDNLPTIIKVAFDIVNALISGLIRAIPMLFTAAVGLIFALGKVLYEKIMDGTLFEIGGQIIMGLITGMVSMLAALIQMIFDVGLMIFNGIKEFFGIASPSKLMADVGKWIIQGLINGIKAYFEILKLLWVTIPTWLFDQFKNALTWLYNFGKDILTGLWNGIKWYFDTVFKAAFKVGTWIIDAFKGAGSWLWDAGKNIMEGLKNGIFSVAGNIASWVGELGGNFVKGVKKFFGIKSPSRVMMGIGGMIGEGLALGIDGTTKDIMKAAADMQSAATIGDISASYAADASGIGDVISGSVGVDLGKMQIDYDKFAKILARELKNISVLMDDQKMGTLIDKRIIKGVI